MILLVATMVEAGTPGPTDRVLQYYIHLNDRDYAAAWRLKSQAARGKQSLQAFQKNWANCTSVGFFRGPEVQSQDARSAVVNYVIQAVDQLPGNKLKYGTYRLKTTLVREGGAWRYNGPQILDRGLSLVA